MNAAVRTLTIFQSYKMQRLTFDGVQTAFPLATVAGVIPNIQTATDLLVSIDGVIQEPDAAYTASNDVIQFTTAPSVDSVCFIVWWSH